MEKMGVSWGLAPTVRHILQYVTGAVFRGVSPESSEGDKRTMPRLANNHNSTPTQPQLNHNDRGADLPRIIPAWRGGGVTGGLLTKSCPTTSPKLCGKW